jgi:hypothetical protein
MVLLRLVLLSHPALSDHDADHDARDGPGTLGPFARSAREEREQHHGREQEAPIEEAIHYVIPIDGLPSSASSQAEVEGDGADER